MGFTRDYGDHVRGVTRAWPVSGDYGASQPELCEIYVGCHRTILKVIKIELTASAVLQMAVKEMDDVLASRRFLNCYIELQRMHSWRRSA
jgi:hypothetical protein